MNNLFLAVMLTASMLLSGCAAHKFSESECQQAKEKNHPAAEQYVLYAMMSSNSYHQEKEGYFPIEILGWERIDTKENPTGLAFDIWRKKDNGDIVVAFRGSDSKRDYFLANFSILSPSYKSTFKQYGKIHDQYKGKNIIVTGHSLGGGLALGVSLRYGVKAVVFDTSPRCV